jgi:hypothetical protein
MVRQVGRRGERRTLFQIGGRGAYDPFRGGELARDEGGIFKLAGADVDVDALRHEVDGVVRQDEVDADLRIAAHEIGQRVRHMLVPHQHA